MLHPVPTNKALTTKSQRYNYFIRNGGNAVPKHACLEAQVTNPTVGRALLWAWNPLGENSDYWHVSKEVSGRIVKINIIKIYNATSV